MNLQILCQKTEKICSEIKNDFVLGNYFIHSNPWVNRPWRNFNYWNGWYALAKLKEPENILEIGTGFGFSTMALARGAQKTLKLLVSLDFGTFGKEFKWKDNLPYVKQGIEEFKTANSLNFLYKQFNIDTQDFYLHQKKYQSLREYLCSIRFNLILIDGKHTEDGLYNDLNCFFRLGSEDCLIICDDIQHPHARKSFFRFVDENKKEISESYIWKFLTCNAPYAGSFERNQGLIIKK